MRVEGGKPRERVGLSIQTKDMSQAHSIKVQTVLHSKSTYLHARKDSNVIDRDENNLIKDRLISD